MDISFRCYSCGQNIVIDEAATGLHAQCPKCGQPITVPRQDAPHPKPVTGERAEVPESISDGSRRIPLWGALLLVVLLLIAVAFAYREHSKATALGRTVSSVRSELAKANTRLAAITEQTLTEPEPTYQGVRVSEWIRLTGDNDRKTEERAWGALSSICKPNDKNLAQILTPIVRNALTNRNPNVRYYASLCGLALNGDYEGYRRIAESVAASTFADETIRHAALGAFDGIARHRSRKEIEEDNQALSRIIAAVSEQSYPTDADGHILSFARYALEKNAEELSEKD